MQRALGASPSPFLSPPMSSPMGASGSVSPSSVGDGGFAAGKRLFVARPRYTAKRRRTTGSTPSGTSNDVVSPLPRTPAEEVGDANVVWVNRAVSVYTPS